MSIYDPRTELDLLAVQHDGVALDALARRQTREPLGEDALLLLSALTADVDAGLEALLATPLQMPLRSAATGEIPSLADARRRRTARVVTGAVIVAGLVSVSGVSAAVTGDPLTPYRNVISTVSGRDQAPRTRSVEDEAVHRQVLSIGAAIDAGQLDRAQAAVQRLHTRLDDKPRAGQRSALAQLAALEAKLAKAVAKDKADETRGPQGQPGEGNGRNDATGGSSGEGSSGEGSSGEGSSGNGSTGNGSTGSDGSKAGKTQKVVPPGKVKGQVNPSPGGSNEGHGDEKSTASGTSSSSPRLKHKPTARPTADRSGAADAGAGTATQE